MKLTFAGIFIALFLVLTSIQSAYAAPGTPGTAPGPAGKFTIFGTGVIGDNLAPGWVQDSLFNGPNTWNLVETEQFYAGNHSLSWTSSAAFERGWVTGPTPLNLGLYQYLTFYARATQVGQNYDVGFVNRAGEMVGTWVPIDSGGGPIQPDRWQSYSWPISTFDVAAEVYGIGIREKNGGQQPKVFFDEILLSDSPGTPAVISPGLGQPGIPVEPPAPKGPYYPNISPWVFIIPGIIVMLAIFFE